MSDSSTPAATTSVEPAGPTEERHPLYGTSNRDSGCDDPAVDQLFSRGRLVQMPSMRGRNQVLRDKLLAFIATSRFEAGVGYSEQEVNERLMAVYDDHTSLRRYLVEDRHLERDRAGREYRLPA